MCASGKLTSNTLLGSFKMFITKKLLQADALAKDDELKKEHVQKWQKELFSGIRVALGNEIRDKQVRYHYDQIAEEAESLKSQGLALSMLKATIARWRKYAERLRNSLYPDCLSLQFNPDDLKQYEHGTPSQPIAVEHRGRATEESSIFHVNIFNLWGWLNMRESVAAQVVRGLFALAVAAVTLFGANELIKISINKKETETQKVHLKNSPDSPVNQSQIKVEGDFYNFSLPIQAPTTTPKEPSSPKLSPPQETILKKILECQIEHDAKKLVISRDGALLFLEPGGRKVTNKNLVPDGVAPGEFEWFIESIPATYLRMYSETRFDNPFVVAVTDAGIDYLQKTGNNH